MSHYVLLPKEENKQYQQNGVGTGHTLNTLRQSSYISNSYLPYERIIEKWYALALDYLV